MFDAALVDDLRDQANEALAHFGDRLDGRTVFVTKHTLASVHDCEVHFLAPDEFEWTPARARGQVAHKAIQLMLNWRGEPSPRELVDEALARLGDEERDFGRWIAGLSPGDEADLRGQGGRTCQQVLRMLPAARRAQQPGDRSRGAVAARSPHPASSPRRSRHGPARGPREPQGDHRPEDRPGQPTPSRRPAVLCAGRDAGPRRAAAQAGHLLPRLRPARSSKTSPKGCCAPRCGARSTASIG